MNLLQLASAELGRNITADSDTDAVSREDASRASDIARCDVFGLLRPVALPTLRGKLRRLPGGRRENSARERECDPSLNDHGTFTGRLARHCGRIIAARVRR